ncbi:hypothetical protein BH11PLA2_BH11PLA2_16590 [soil metagenome]
MSLDTLANVKLQLNVSKTEDDALLAALQAAADDYVNSYCGRSFTGGTFTEDHPGASRLLFLAQFPLASVTSLSVDSRRQFAGSTVWSNDRYVVYEGRGVIESLEGPFLPGSAERKKADANPKTVRVIYTTAEDAVPDALKRAYAELIGHWYRQTLTWTATEQQNLIVKADTTQYPWQQSNGFKLPPGVKMILDLYRVPL